MTFGERVDALIVECGAAASLDSGINRLASALDPTDTDEGMEQVADEIRERLRSVLADLAVRKGWRLP